jgi:hypothetical protein
MNSTVVQYSTVQYIPEYSTVALAVAVAVVYFLADTVVRVYERTLLLFR